MRQTTIWYDIVGSIERSALDERLTALLASGLRLYPRGAGVGASGGILFFDTAREELHERLRSVSRDGHDRVLAIPLHAVPQDDEMWTLLDNGASDVITWDPTAGTAVKIAARFDRWQAVDDILERPVVRANLIGRARAWHAVMRQVVEIAHFTDASVLILGESGTGKELIARLIHALDTRPHKRDLVILDCTTVVPELSGSEFFGHERGAFTGAARPRDGAFALANEGTLFLDEIGDLPPALQAQLLRAIQERTYKPVGGNVWQSTSFRLICATHRRLDEDVASGSFRADLYYRIGGVVCRVPPLRERPEDIVPLFQHFVAKQTERDELPEIDDAVRRWLQRRAYPGNVRELQQIARRTACGMVGGGAVTIGDIPVDARPHGEAHGADESSLEIAIRQELARGVGLKEISRAAASAAIRVALDDANGSVQVAARQLRVTDRALQLRRAGATSARRKFSA
jgi:transcriptional regulator with GAF, ATPase, and Fis domain